MSSDLNNSISLLSRIHTKTADFLLKKLSEEGLSDFASSHGNILFQLSVNEKLSMGDLAHKINRDKSTTTVLVRKLIKEGLIIEQINESDKRNKFISLTEKGNQYNKLTSALSSQLLSTFYNGFTEEEKNQFLSFLQRIDQNFN